MATKRRGGRVTTRSREGAADSRLVIATTALKRIVHVIESTYAAWVQVEDIERMAREALAELGDE